MSQRAPPAGDVGSVRGSAEKKSEVGVAREPLIFSNLRRGPSQRHAVAEHKVGAISICHPQSFSSEICAKRMVCRILARNLSSFAHLITLRCDERRRCLLQGHIPRMPQTAAS